MEKFTKGIKGSISLFLSMIILLLVILEGFLIDGSKVLAAKMFMSGAGDLALNAGLTYYDEALRDIYGLFATCETEEELTANLKVYFQETLGEATGNSDGEYVDQLLDYINTSIQNGWDGEQAGKLIDLTLDAEGFSARGVENSALSETYVIKNQILEYMKYRGPASLGYGMIEKIYAFKDLDKQQKTLEAKLNYEETMSDVQEACEKAYTNIEEYNKLLENSLKPERVETVSEKINKNIQEAIIATWCYSVVKRDPEIKENWQKKTSVRGHDVEAAYDACSHMSLMSELYDQMEGDQKAGFDGHLREAMAAVKIMIGYKEEYDNYCNLYTTWKNYLEYYNQRMKELERELDSLDEDEDGDDIIEEMKALEKEREGYEKIYEEGETKINLFKNALKQVVPVLESDINERMNEAVTKLNEIAKDAETLRLLGTNGKEDLDDVIKSMSTLESRGQAWQSSIDNLSAGEVKTSMQADYSNKSEMLDREKIQVLQEKLVNGITYAEILKNAAQATKGIHYMLFEGEKSSYHPYMKSKLESSVYANETLPYNGTPFQGFNVGEWFKNAKNTNALSDEACTVYFKNIVGENNTGQIVKMDLAVYKNHMDTVSGREDEFFKYLERVCPKSEAEEQSKNEANAEKSKLFEQAKKASLSPDESLPTLSKPSGSQESGAGFTETDTGAKDKEVSKNAKENSKTSANFLADVNNLLLKGRDKLYISEYATQMFSYYTVDKPKSEDGAAPDVKKTLSGYPFTAENNSMYKAEVEYILWGNPSGQADVQYTLTTIFGIRFLLNSIYAFTGDPEIRQISLMLATSIAGWTGFGIPLVQSVLIIAFALAETSLDIIALKEGKSVPIYKSTSNWQIKPSALTKEAIGQAINDAGSAAKEYLFDQIDQLTEDTKGKFREKLTEFSDETVDNLVSVANASVLIPVQERLIGLVNVVSSDGDKISSSIGEALDGVKASINAEEDSIAKTIKLEAVTAFENGLMDRVVSAVQDVQNNNELSNEMITQKICGTIEQCRVEMSESIQHHAKELVEQECGMVNSALDSANEELQEKTSEAFDQMLMRIDCGVSFADVPNGDMVDLDGGKGRTTGAAALTMDYREYLWLFIAVKSIQNENDMLKRIGTLIEANLADSATAPSPDFKIDSAYTFIEVDAKADLSTTFFSLPVPVSGGGGVVLGQDKYSIGYRGVLGY